MVRCPWCGQEVEVEKYGEHYNSCPKRQASTPQEQSSNKGLVDYEAIASEVPDTNNPAKINYWLDIGKYKVYVEGWCDKCFAGTGIGEYETQAKLNYAEDLSPQIFEKKQMRTSRKFLEGRFIETPDKDFIVGVTIGVYLPAAFETSPQTPEASIREKIEAHFSSEKAKPIPVSSVFGGAEEVKAYSSHGVWSTLRNIREIELERGNVFPDLPDYLPGTAAIWVCFTKRLALRYVELAEEWDRLMGSSPLTEEDEMYLQEIAEVTLKPSDLIAWTDFDQGYLILRPPPKGAPAALMDVDPRVRSRLRLNIEEARRQWQEYGEWYEYVFEPAVPISKIKLPPPWNEWRYKDNKKKIGETGAMPPGIHRINAAKDLGYTAVPAVAAYRRTYPPP